MAKFTLGAQEFNQESQSDFSEFITIAKGRSIISGANWGKDRIEFGLSGDTMLRIFWEPDGLKANFISTTNQNEIPPLMLQLVDGEKRIPARILEQRLRALKTLYAIVHLSKTNRFDLVQKALLQDENYDFELLLDEDDLLYIECLAPGSWYITLWSKTRKSYKSILQTVGLISTRGREAILTKLEAEAKLKDLEVEEKEFELMTKKMDYGLGLIDKLSSDPAKSALKNRVELELSNLLISKPHSDDVQNAKDNFLEN